MRAVEATHPLIFDLAVYPSQVVFPLGIAIVYLVLIFYNLSWRRPESAIERWFLAYLILTVLWNFSLVVAVNGVLELLPGLTWKRLSAYGLIILGFTYWSFALAFLYRPWQIPWRWAVLIVGLLSAVALDLRLFVIPPGMLSWSNGWLTAENLGFALSVIFWGLFMLLALGMVFAERARLENPAHRNRIHYLLICTLLFIGGYALYLSLREPFWTTGLIITGLAGVLNTYIVTVEDLLDLGTGLRRVARGILMVVITVSVYIVAVYLVQTFLGQFLQNIFAGLVDETLLITSFAVIFLAIFYIAYPADEREYHLSLSSVAGL